MIESPWTPFIEFDGICKYFGEPPNQAVALQNLSFAVNQKEIITFVGPSGCGKTTVLRILSGLETPTTGRVAIKGRPVQIGMCGMVFQSYSSFPWLTVLENVAFGLKLQQIPEKQRHETARRFIDLVGLSGFENRYPKELSGGQKQRVAIARTLAVQADVLLMDEPFGALDIKIRSEMQELLLSIWRKLKPTILLVTHDIQEAIYLPNRIFIFSRPSLDPNNSGNQVTEMEIKKPVFERNPEWKNSDEFAIYEKQIKDLHFD
ncbi:ABC transporter ATP-binding protein [candidate division KSB1 bacterium]|nr:ABC transporter ATP-binding protein [candidate division KSB1 bacterium]